MRSRLKYDDLVSNGLLSGGDLWFGVGGGNAARLDFKAGV